MNNEFENIQAIMDGFSEILSELKTENQSLKTMHQLQDESSDSFSRFLNENLRIGEDG